MCSIIEVVLSDNFFVRHNRAESTRGCERPLLAIPCELCVVPVCNSRALCV